MASTQHSTSCSEVKINLKEFEKVVILWQFFSFSKTQVLIFSMSATTVQSFILTA